MRPRWQDINEMRKPYIRLGEHLFGRMLKLQHNELKQALTGVRAVADIEKAITDLRFKTNVFEWFGKYYVETGVGMAKRQLRSLRRRKGNELKYDEEFFGREDIWTEKMLNFVGTRCGRKIAAVTRTSYADIESITKAAISRGIESGLGAFEIAELIERKSGEIDLWRALRIARTEVLSASNEGMMMGAAEMGEAMTKIWLATGFPGPGGHMREDHEVMNDVAVDMNEPFTLPDGVQMDYPGDPDAPPEHVINCRCSIAFEVKKL